MPHVGPVLEGRTFFCPHCGALYSVTPTRLSRSESNTPKCVVCATVMDRRDTTDALKLIQRPEDVDDGPKTTSRGRSRLMIAKLPELVR